MVILAGIGYAQKRNNLIHWVPMNTRIRIWDSVVSKHKGVSIYAARAEYTTSANGLVATYEKNGAMWSIIGANAAVNEPTIYPSHWKIRDRYYDILIINDPFMDRKVLPFTDQIEGIIDGNTIFIEGAPDSYESASFVIRSGELDLKNVIIEVSDLIMLQQSASSRHLSQKIPKECIDITIVKCWYQAGRALNDTNHKILTPELLIHDDNIVLVDYEHQVNIIRNLKTIRDSDNLLPFTAPKRQNKQVWLTVHISDDIKAGKYVRGDKNCSATITYEKN